LSQLPLVSVITPSLNQRRFIEATIESVLSQDYPRVEYIVADGGSVDGTLDVLRRYEGRLAWFSEADGGQSEAVNKGFRRAKGEILAWLNSDDTYLPGAIGAAVEHLTAHPDCAMVYGDGYLIDDTGTAIRRIPTEPFNLWKLVYVDDYILQQTTFFRRAALEGVDYLDERLHWAMDWDLFIRIGKRYRVDYLPRDMANLREHRAAKTLSGGRKRLTELMGMMRRHGTWPWPPALVTFGIQTYSRLIFRILEGVIPGSLAGPWLRARRLLGRPVSQCMNRLTSDAQGYYSDGWVSGRAYFLLPRREEGRQIFVRGMVPVVRTRPNGIAVDMTVNGVRLPRRRVDSWGDFDVGWSIPADLGGADLLEVTVECAPTFRRSGVPLRGDRRRLGFQLKEIVVA
jgi:glycosyltransferase involved in cell wall biosynthesis